MLRSMLEASLFRRRRTGENFGTGLRRGVVTRVLLRVLGLGLFRV